MTSDLLGGGQRELDAAHDHLAGVVDALLVVVQEDVEHVHAHCHD